MMHWQGLAVQLRIGCGSLWPTKAWYRARTLTEQRARQRLRGRNHRPQNTPPRSAVCAAAERETGSEMIFKVEARPEELHVIRHHLIPNSLATGSNSRVVTAELVPLSPCAELAEICPADLDA